MSTLDKLKNVCYHYNMKNKEKNKLANLNEQNEAKAISWIKEIIDEASKEIGCEDFFFCLELATEQPTRRNGAVAVMEIVENNPYRQAKIRLYPCAIPMYNSGNKEILLMSLLHELCHLKTNKIYDAAVDRFSSKDLIENLNEGLTDEISRLLEKVLKLKNPKKFKL